MDTLSHTLWGKGLFGYRKYGALALLFGALPDLLSFGLYFLVRLLSQGMNIEFGRPAVGTIPDWVFTMYNFSHSFIIVLFIFIIAFIIDKDLCFPLLAWPFHILLDFLFHSIDFFPTPILWPISDYKFDGVAWSNPYIWIGNIICIIILFIYRYKRKSNEHV